MGHIMGDWDSHIGSLFDIFNQRFAAPQSKDESLYGGISEMVALQREFKIFQKGRPFVESARLLGLGGLSNNLVKNLWFKLLADLSSYESDTAGQNGDERIVNALISNLEASKPLPCVLTSHDSRAKDGRKVIVTSPSQPIHYIEAPHITISLPMRPKGSKAPAAKAPPKKKK